MAGLSTSPGMYDDVYIVRTKPNPCGLSTQVTIGNETGDKYNEQATDIVEVLAARRSRPRRAGRLVRPDRLSGDQIFGGRRLPALRQAHLALPDRRAAAAATTATGWISAPRWPRTRAFGPQAPGFVISGTTTTDWDGSADPSDLYLIQTTDAAKTGCEKEWFPDGADWPWPESVFNPTFPKIARQLRVDTKEFQGNTAAKACN